MSFYPCLFVLNRRAKSDLTFQDTTTNCREYWPVLSWFSVTCGSIIAHGMAMMSVHVSNLNAHCVLWIMHVYVYAHCRPKSQ